MSTESGIAELPEAAERPAEKSPTAKDTDVASKTDAPLSTESLVGQLKNLFESQPEPTAKVPGPESSPEAVAESDADKAEKEVEKPPAESDETGDDAKEKGDAKLPPEIQARIDKRVDKAVAKQRKAEAELETLRERLAELESQKTQSKLPELPPNADPILNLPEIQAIRVEEQKARDTYELSKSLLVQLRKEPEVVAEQLKAYNVRLKSYDPDDIHDFLDESKERSQQQLHQLETKREVLAEKHRTKLETERERNESKALGVYPWLGEEESAEYKVAREYIERFPAIKNLPDWPYLLGDLVAGRQIREAKAKTSSVEKKITPKLPPPAAPKLPAATPAIPSRNGDEPSSSELFKQFTRTGSPADKERWMKSLLAGTT